MKEKLRGVKILLIILCISFGGAIGAGIRAALGFLSSGWWRWVILAIYLTGAFLLGLLASLVAAKSSAHPGFKKLSSLVGTAIMGAYAGLGTFIDGAGDRLLSSLSSFHSLPFATVGYALSSLVAGVFLAALGLYIGKKIFKEAKEARESL